MGMDIEGWIEYAQKSNRGGMYWSGAFKLGSIPNRVYDMFGSLFGVSNYAHFKPIAPDRGLPTDASGSVKYEWSHWKTNKVDLDDEYQEMFHPTWISWQEMKNIDWEEEAEEIDERSFFVYKRGTDGELINESCVDNGKVPYEIQKMLRTHGICEQGEWVYKGRKVKRKEPVSMEWRLLFDIMSRIADQYGEENVRLVVWFWS